MFLGGSISQPWQPPMRGQDYFADLLIGGYDYDAHPGQNGKYYSSIKMLQVFLQNLICDITPKQTSNYPPKKLPQIPSNIP